MSRKYVNREHDQLHNRPFLDTKRHIISCVDGNVANSFNNQQRTKYFLDDRCCGKRMYMCNFDFVV